LEVVEQRVDKFTITQRKEIKIGFLHTPQVANDAQRGFGEAIIIIVRKIIYFKASPREILVG
jgi:hypothetical protein